MRGGNGIKSSDLCRLTTDNIFWHLKRKRPQKHNTAAT